MKTPGLLRESLLFVAMETLTLSTAEGTEEVATSRWQQQKKRSPFAAAPCLARAMGHVIIECATTARKGQVVVALTDENEATLKRWYPEKGRIRLQPANRKMRPIYVKQAKILGVLVGVVRGVR